MLHFIPRDASKKAKRTLAIGVAVAVTGLILGDLGAFYHPAKPKASGSIAPQSACLSAWRGLGLTAYVKGPMIQITQMDQTNAKAQLATASLGIAMCYPTYILQYFCMGQGCPQPHRMVVRLQPAR
jgi:hypothetical protein